MLSSHIDIDSVKGAVTDQRVGTILSVCSPSNLRSIFVKASCPLCIKCKIRCNLPLLLEGEKEKELANLNRNSL